MAVQINPGTASQLLSAAEAVESDVAGNTGNTYGSDTKLYQDASQFSNIISDTRIKYSEPGNSPGLNQETYDFLGNTRSLLDEQDASAQGTEGGSVNTVKLAADNLITALGGTVPSSGSTKVPSYLPQNSDPSFNSTSTSSAPSTTAAGGQTTTPTSGTSAGTPTAGATVDSYLSAEKTATTSTDKASDIDNAITLLLAQANGVAVPSSSGTTGTGTTASAPTSSGSGSSAAPGTSSSVPASSGSGSSSASGTSSSIAPVLQDLQQLTGDVTNSTLPEATKNNILDNVGSLVQQIATDQSSSGTTGTGTTGTTASNNVPVLQDLQQLSNDVESSSLPEATKSQLQDNIANILQQVESGTGTTGTGTSSTSTSSTGASSASGTSASGSAPSYDPTQALETYLNASNAIQASSLPDTQKNQDLDAIAQAVNATSNALTANGGPSGVTSPPVLTPAQTGSLVQALSDAATEIVNDPSLSTADKQQQLNGINNQLQSIQQQVLSSSPGTSSSNGSSSASSSSGSSVAAKYAPLLQALGDAASTIESSNLPEAQKDSDLDVIAKQILRIEQRISNDGSSSFGSNVPVSASVNSSDNSKVTSTQTGS